MDMQRIFRRALCFAALLGVLPQKARAVNLVFDAMPVSFLSSPKINGLSMQNGVIAESYQGSLSYTPITKVGIGLDLPDLYIDLTAAGGLLTNRAFSSSLYGGDMALRFKLGEKVTLGPHCSVLRIAPRWNNGVLTPDDVHIGAGTAVLPGVVLTVGKTVSFQASVDYLAMKALPLTTYNGWMANRTSLNLSGVMVQLGVIFRFFKADREESYSER